MTDTVVLTGAAGILGQAFLRLLDPAHVVCLGRNDLNAAAPDAVRRRIADAAPCLVINCAADTDVEGAEAAPDRAFATNRDLAAAVAAGAAETGAGFVHMSSTGCYGDWKTAPYEETDPLRPTTVHHRSKAEGEDAVQRAHPGALILRLGWLFGGTPGQRKNFVWARLREADRAVEIGSNPSQTGNPTWVDDVAAQSLALREAGASGVYNAVGAGASATRLQYVTAILAAAGSATRVVPVTFPRRAPVSPNESAVNARLLIEERSVMQDWRDALSGFVQALQVWPEHG